MTLLRFAVHAQTEGHAITGRFDGYSFKQFVEEVEKQSIYRFYYRPEWIDSLVIRASPYQGDLQTFLAGALVGTDLNFTITSSHKVYITKEREISTVLPDGFFPENKISRSLVVFDYSAFEDDVAKQNATEDRLNTVGKASSSDSVLTITGFILNGLTGEPLVGASVFVEDLSIGTTTDASGIYWMTLPRGQHILRIEMVGMKSTRRKLLANGSGKFNIEMQEAVIPLKEVVVESQHDSRVNSVKMGVERMDIKAMKQMPLVLGETDILKVMLTLPGVQSVGEGASGLNVRGGTTNQNLILYNDAVVYNPAHVFGFFSAFNPDVVKDVELYKSGITAEYGGRLSSVMDITSREGNLKKLTVSGGISPITGRLTIEGPIVRDKTSFLLAGRSTYSSWLLRQLKSRYLKNSQASFYDLNLIINHRFDDRNSIHLSTYGSNDRFTLNNDTLYAYSDQNASLKWKHVFNNKWYGVITGSYSQYRYNVSADKNPVNAFAMNFQVRQLTAKVDVDHFLNSQHIVKAGVQVTHYGLAPGELHATGAESIVVSKKLADERGIESAVYIGDNFDVTPELTIYGGIRYSFYQYLGPRDVFEYANGISRSRNSIIDTISFGKGRSISRYHGPEPRFFLRYLTGKKSSIKISYTRMRQYIQMLSNTIAIAPTDTWKLSDTYIKPQLADQYAIGYYRNLKGGAIEFSAEAYYKIMKNALDFKDGAVILMNHHIETDVLNVNGKAYGLEFLLKKPSGKLNGWISYTFSRSLLQTKGSSSAEVINKGEYYPSSYDKPHAANFIGNYKFSRRFNLSLNVVYSTGRPITIPLAKYPQNGNMHLYYSDRNAFRIPDYFRTDISINVEGNHKVRKLAHSSWTLAVYNATGRANAYSVFFVSENNQIKGYKLSVFARPIPTITYNFKF